MPNPNKILLISATIFNVEIMLFRTLFLGSLIFLFACSGNPGPKVVSKKSNAVRDSSLYDVKSLNTEMILFEGGTFMMGSEKGLPNERPVHKVIMNPFHIDKSPVTVGQFRKFIESTGFKTDAERFGDSGVFDYGTQSWSLIPGACWNFPLGKDKPQSDDNLPVTQVSWNDAIAFSHWAGKRLPTEAEWEYAARCGGKNNFRFSWGDQLLVNGKFQANVWQGNDVAAPQGADGFMNTSPVGYFGMTPCGLTDMGGNVWNWCSDIYGPYPGNKDPFEPNNQLRVIRGGSFLFDQNGENSFSATGRGFNTFETSLFNTGFRCARDAK
jgi:sulfatase modifying factor 1